MRLVLDTNCALSGLLWGGTSGQLIAAAETDGYAALVTTTLQAAITPTIARDPTDDEVLACALAASGDLIVSGDAHLLDLKRFHGLDIVMPAEALRRISA